MWIPITALLVAGQAPMTAAHPAPSQDATVAPTADNLQGRYEVLLKEYESARDAYRKADSAARKEHRAAGGSRDDFKGAPAIEGSFYPKFLAIADSGHAPAGVWCLSNHDSSELEGDAAKADKLRRYHSILDAKPGDDVLYSLLRPMNGDTRGQAPAIAKKTAYAFLDKIRAQAESTGLEARTVEEKAGIAARSSATPDALAEAVVFYKEIMTRYPDSVSARRVKGPLFAAENLQIGMKAPDIVGQDHDGHEIKLSDFSGKVTVIDFWGFW